MTHVNTLETATSAQAHTLAQATANLAHWLETMRGPRGYGGPVAHWWQQSLIYTGPGLDWRYEGIICGYVQLWQRTGNKLWLQRARQAADDIVQGQAANGHFAASAFEINPASAGTPHEAAACVGLLTLVKALKQANQTEYEAYLACAQQCLHNYYIKQLWDSTLQAFRDSPAGITFVPNKAATACDAFFLLTEITGDSSWVDEYVLPTLTYLLKHQVQTPGKLHGAIAQNSFGTRIIAKYFPIYIARCVSALVQAYRWSNQEQYLSAAKAALAFIERYVRPDGSFATVVYANTRTNEHPAWIAALGDILRAADELSPYGITLNLQSTIQRLLQGQDTTGGIQTATGFAAQASNRHSNKRDVRDILHVAGWCDKAFRWLTTQIKDDLPAAQTADLVIPCTFQGQKLLYSETNTFVKLHKQNSIVYHWQKGTDWPEQATEAFWLH